MPHFGVVIGFFPPCHSVFREPIRFIHLINDMDNDVIIRYCYVPLGKLSFCLPYLFEICWEDLGLLQCNEHFFHELYFVPVHDFADFCSEVNNYFIGSLSLISYIFLLEGLHKWLITAWSISIPRLFSTPNNFSYSLTFLRKMHLYIKPRYLAMVEKINRSKMTEQFGLLLYVPE